MSASVGKTFSGGAKSRITASPNGRGRFGWRSFTALGLLDRYAFGITPAAACGGNRRKRGVAVRGVENRYFILGIPDVELAVGVDCQPLRIGELCGAGDLGQERVAARGVEDKYLAREREVIGD